LTQASKLRRNNQYVLNFNSIQAINTFIENSPTFAGYNRFYSCTDFTLEDISNVNYKWFYFVNKKIDEKIFKTDLIEFLQSLRETASTTVSSMIQDFIRGATEGDLSSHEIGDYGENIIIVHEKNRLQNGGRADIMHKVRKIPDNLGVGYDILSAELDEAQRFVEVKTTISKSRITIRQFHLTTNEWVSAEGLGEYYFVYRVMVNEEEIKLFIIQNPVRKYKIDQLKMVPRDGADVTFDYEAGEWQDLLL